MKLLPINLQYLDLDLSCNKLGFNWDNFKNLVGVI